jgi:hypothetical protein
MQRQEILSTRYGEFVDMISCLAVYNGTAKEKEAPADFDIFELR